jgi:hypothetical protein
MLKDRVGLLQFLLMPVAKISGIEDSILLYPRTPNFFAQAWEQRSFMADTVGSAGSTLMKRFHHSTFSENRLHRFRQSDVFRRIFECVVAACMTAGLVKGEGFAVDASGMEANASRYHAI